MAALRLTGYLFGAAVVCAFGAAISAECGSHYIHWAFMAVGVVSLAAAVGISQEGV
jgi:hypothetical protein